MQYKILKHVYNLNNLGKINIKILKMYRKTKALSI